MSGALLVIAALVLNNIYQRKALRITAVKSMSDVRNSEPKSISAEGEIN
jgi:hypothetical protein